MSVFSGKEVGYDLVPLTFLDETVSCCAPIASIIDNFVQLDNIRRSASPRNRSTLDYLFIPSTTEAYL